MTKKTSCSSLDMALVGMGCRFPGGASDPQRYWAMLLDQRDAITDVPKDRWDIRRFCDEHPEKIGKAYNFQGGFLQEDVKKFDPLFFGISPREAAVMDPQQRLLLEVAWEAFEDAGIPREQFAGSNTGVFIGGFWLDHQINQYDSLNTNMINSHSPMSATLTLLSNRLSHAFNLRGPSLTIDTACSSSLVAVHYACQSIQCGDCDSAIVGGVNIMTSPLNAVSLSKGKFLSTHSRCKTFDQDATGYARGEGAAAVLIMPLAKALSAQLPVYAVIKSTGVNQDGQTPGITMPNPDAQKELIRKVYQKAGVSPSQINYVEAHGTGTQAGDVAESHALHEVLNDNGARQAKVWVGSVKTNMGHLEASAGVAGLIKAALCLKHKTIPANLHFNHPNPAIDFNRLCLQVPTQTISLQSVALPLYAGVNSFGYGGTNAHILLASTEPELASKATPVSPIKNVPIPVSAQSVQALRDLAGRYAGYLTEPGAGSAAGFADVVKTLCDHRSHLNVRELIVAKDTPELVRQLSALAQGAGQPGLVAAEKERKLVFVLTGMGPQWWGMGRQLWETEPVFRSAVEACDKIFQALSGWSIQAEMLAAENASRMEQTQIAQPANFILQAALAALWKSWGIKPDAVIGHSVGEVAAAYLAGVLTLEESIRVSYHRSRLQQSLANQQAGMLALNLSSTDVERLLTEQQLNLSIAAVNSRTGITLSGKQMDLQKVSEWAQAQGLFNRFLKVEVAFHSEYMDPIREELLAVLKDLRPQAARVPFYSTVTGERMDGHLVNADYWWLNVRNPVCFQKGVAALLSDGYTHFLEVGPHPVLAQSIQAELNHQHREAYLFKSLDRKTEEQATLLQSLGELFKLGYAVNWKEFIEPTARMLRLPHYPWQHERYWSESTQLDDYLHGQAAPILLNRKLEQSEPTWEIELNRYYLPYLPDHRIGNTVVVPGALYVEAILAAQSSLHAQEPWLVENIRFHQVLSLQPEKVHYLQIRLERKTGRADIYSSCREEGASWMHHASAEVKPLVLSTPTKALRLTEVQNRCPEEIGVDDFYKRLADRNLNYGEYFKPIRRIQRGAGEVLITLDPAQLPAIEDGYLLGPTLLDALFQALIVVDRTASTEENRTYIPVTVDQLIVYAKPECPCFGQITLEWKNEETLKGHARLINQAGEVIAEVNGITCQHLAQERETSDAVDPDWFHAVVWKEEARPEAPEHGLNWLVVDLGSRIMEDYQQRLTAQGINVVCVRHENLEIECTQPAKAGTNSRLSIAEVVASHVVDQVVFMADALAPTDAIEISSQSAKDCHLLSEWIRQMHAKAPEHAWSCTMIGSGVSAQEKGLSKAQLCQAPLVGLLRVARNEYSGISCRTIDLAEDLSPDQALEALVAETRLKLENEEVIITPHSRKVCRLQKHVNHEADKPAERITRIPVAEGVTLARAQAAENTALLFERQVRKELGAEEVEIQIEAYVASRHFSGGRKVDANTLRAECVGKIVRIGANVKNAQCGDKVAIWAPMGIATFLTLPANQVNKINEWAPGQEFVSQTEIAAYHALFECAHLQAGESLLLQGSLSEIGRAVVRFALAAKIQVHVLCTDEQEKAQWADKGLQLWAENEIRQNYELRVRAVVNASMQPLSRSLLSAVVPGGVIVQFSRENAGTGLGIDPMLRNKSLHLIDVETMLREQPERVLHSVRQIIAKGLGTEPTTVPLRVDLADLGQALDALNTPGQHRKIIITMQGEVPLPEQSKSSLVNAQSSYLITGGTNGFGFEIAQWLAKQGAGHLILVSRSGESRPDTRAAIDRLRGQGQAVTVFAVDVSEPAAVAKMFEQVRATLLPLKGVVHSAMVLEDQYIKDITLAQYEAVFKPKIRGALNLDEQTQGDALDFFVMFSSISSLIGNPGQANYAAANSFLDALAVYRQGLGRPALTINWGVLAESGVVARNQQVAELLAHAGLKGFSNTQAQHALAKAMSSPVSQLGIFDVDWDTWFSQNQKLSQCPMFAPLSNSKSLKCPQWDTLIGRLQGLGPEEQAAYLEDQIKQVISKVVNVPVEKIPRTQNIMNLGVDSLMALDLGRRLKADLGIDISVLELMNGPSVARLGTLLLSRLTPYLQEIKIAQVDDLSEEELDRLLQAELKV